MLFPVSQYLISHDQQGGVYCSPMSCMHVMRYMILRRKIMINIARARSTACEVCQGVSVTISQQFG